MTTAHWDGHRCPACEAETLTDGTHRWCSRLQCRWGHETPEPAHQEPWWKRWASLLWMRHGLG